MNEESPYVEELLAFFKALSNANRLKIVALLAKESLSVEQMAEILDLNASTVSHHLAKLSKVGLVKARSESYYNMYYLELTALTAMAERILSAEMLPTVAEDVDADAYDRKVLQTFLDANGRLTSFPAQQKKEEAVLRHIIKVFEPGQRYSEKEVKEMLSQFNEDYARLRRDLVEFGFMNREGGGGAYWRVEA